MKYIVLLRGINVGGRTLKMAELKKCFETAGFHDVVTVLQTGNVIMESNESHAEKLREQVENLLGNTFHYPARVLVITTGYLKKIIREYPFQNSSPEFHRYVVFTEKGCEEELAPQAAEYDEDVEAVSPGEGVVYWRVLKGYTLESAFGKHMAKASAKHFMTNRNLNTLEKILAKCG